VVALLLTETSFLIILVVTDKMIFVYNSRAVSPGKMVQLIMALKPEEQIQVFNMLRETLIKRGLLALK